MKILFNQRRIKMKFKEKLKHNFDYYIDIKEIQCLHKELRKVERDIKRMLMIPNCCSILMLNYCLNFLKKASKIKLYWILHIKIVLLLLDFEIWLLLLYYWTPREIFYYKTQHYSTIMIYSIQIYHLLKYAMNI